MAVAITLSWTLPAIAQPGTAQTRTVRVEVNGVEGELRDNILYYLTLNEASGPDLSAGRIRHLHQQGVHEIRRALQPFGYYRPEVESKLDADGSLWVAHYKVAVGSPIRIRNLDLRLRGEGKDENRFQELVNGFPLRPGEVLRHAAYADAKAEFKATAAELGYLDAQFDSSRIQVDLEPYHADIVLHLDTGPRFKFGPVTFEQDILDPDVLTNYVPFRRGDPYSNDDLLQLQSNLTESPYFTRVEVRPQRSLNAGLEVPVQVDLEPQKPRRYELGFGYGTDTGFRGRFETEFRRLNRQGHRALAEIQLSQIERSVSSRYIIPRAHPSTAVLTFFAGFADLDPTTSRSDRLLGGVSLGSDWGRWRQTLTARYEHESFEVGADTGVSNLLILEADWARKTANDPIFATRGHRVDLEAIGSHDAVISSATFLQLAVRGKLIRSLGERTRLLARGELGGTLTPDFRDLPPSVRFFAGGDRSVRGYAYQALGPVDRNGNVIGGEVLITASLELEHRLLERWGVAAFFDAGDALPALSLSLEQGVGAGLRWLSPVGLARLDGAFAVSQPGNPFRLHLMIGPDL